MKKKRNLWRLQRKALIMCVVIFCMIAASINVKASEPTQTKSIPQERQVPRERRGIDVSKWNGKIDWNKVKKSGVKFAIIRIGYGDDLSSQDDEYAIYNMTECERLGIPYGVYIYSYALSSLEAESEANHVLRMIRGRNLSMPVYMDLEDQKLMELSSQQLATNMSVFSSILTKSGYQVGVYSSTSWFENILTDPVFNQFPKWVAQYNTTCTYNGTYEIWQYTKESSVPGIEGEVDMNILVP